MRAGRWMRGAALGLVVCATGWAAGCSSGTHDSSTGGAPDAGAEALGGAGSGMGGVAATAGTAGLSGVGGVGGQDAGPDSGGAAAGSSGFSGSSGAGGVDAGAGGAAGVGGAAGGDAAQGVGGAAGADAGGDAGGGAADGAAGQAGSDAGIDASVCVPNAYECNGGDLRRCASDGSGYALIQTCQAGHCSAAAGACLECLDATECTVSGQCEQATCVAGSCGSTPLAQGTACTNGVCNGQGVCGCVPGTQRCAGNVPESCDSNGAWQSQSACSGATPDCYDGVCEPPTPPSCASLAETCGPASSSYCCASRAIPGGTFSRSYDGVSPYTDSSYTATVSGFRLDLYEVSVARFRAFVDAGGGTQASPPAAGAGANPAIAGSGWDASWDGDLVADTTALRAGLHCSSSYETWTDNPGANEARPINCVTWYEAFAFCAWDGARLPTEAEWNYAAAGGAEQRAYPWSVPSTSTAIDPDHASYWVNGTQTCMGDGVSGCTVDDLVPVGSKPSGAGRFGQFDMAGNVWEWTLDVYKNPYAISPCNDCADLSKGSSRVIRGGAFFANAAAALTSTRSPATPSSRLYTVGLRCAR